jgi:hypothetical protein
VQTMVFLGIIEMTFALVARVGRRMEESRSLHASGMLLAPGSGSRPPEK